MLGRYDLVPVHYSRTSTSTQTDNTQVPTLISKQYARSLLTSTPVSLHTPSTGTRVLVKQVLCSLGEESLLYVLIVNRILTIDTMPPSIRKKKEKDPAVV